MAEESVTVEISKGICKFCKQEIDKRQMTRHLKSCKQRTATFASAKDVEEKQKTKLFQFVVEGHYDRDYWMNIEVPASESLATLDSFLRATWVECCDHLSAFKIGPTMYESTREYMIFREEDEEEDMDEQEEDDAEDGIGGEEVAKAIVEQFEDRDLQPPDWIAEVKKLQEVDDFVAFAREKLKALPKITNPMYHTHEGIGLHRNHSLQQWVLEDLIDQLEDRSMDVVLERVIKDRKKFLYEYDFGSTTYIDLKLVGEREGLIANKKKPVEILARNIAPAFSCTVCGKPAKLVVGGYYALEESVYCNKCAKKSGEDEMMLPIVNSPRMGVCGYEG